MVTETPRVEEALDRLRAEMGSDRVDIAELVIAGAEAKLSEVRRAETATVRARERLAARIRARTLPLDPDAADEVKRLRLPG